MPAKVQESITSVLTVEVPKPALFKGLIQVKRNRSQKKPISPVGQAKSRVPLFKGRILDQLELDTTLATWPPLVLLEPLLPIICDLHFVGLLFVATFEFGGNAY